MLFHLNKFVCAFAIVRGINAKKYQHYFISLGYNYDLVVKAAA